MNPGMSMGRIAAPFGSFPFGWSLKKSRKE
jgi:hypothetical protein